MNHSSDNVQALHAGETEESERSGKSNKSGKSDKSGKSGKSDKDDDLRPPLSGEGVVVAVLDTGLRPGFGHFETGDFTEGGIAFDPNWNPVVSPAHVPGVTVVGCDDFVFLASTCMDPDNDGHGTMVSGIIAGGATFEFNPGSSMFSNSVFTHAADAVLDLDSDTFPEVATIGSAPGAQIYMIKVFIDSLTPTPSSIVIAAVDHIIRLKQSGVNIQVANLSLGTSTLFAGQTGLEFVTDRLLEEGIVPIASAGNAGPALLTTASPASSYSSVAVGAGSSAHQERIAADVSFCVPFFPFPPIGAFPPLDNYLSFLASLPPQFQEPPFCYFGTFPLGTFPAGEVFGPLPIPPPTQLGSALRPFEKTQTAWFSSRGPNADGRTDPSIMSDGFGVYGAGLGLAPGTVSLGDGTSFSAPNVAGIAALLREAFPGASATQIRNAIVESGNRRIIDDGSGELDEGNGWVDALEAYELLEDGEVSDRLPRTPRTSPLVSQNLDERVRSGRVRNKKINNLDPGEREDILYEVLPLTGELEVVISDVKVKNQ